MRCQRCNNALRGSPGVLCENCDTTSTERVGLGFTTGCAWNLGDDGSAGLCSTATREAVGKTALCEEHMELIEERDVGDLAHLDFEPDVAHVMPDDALFGPAPPPATPVSPEVRDAAYLARARKLGCCAVTVVKGEIVHEVGCALAPPRGRPGGTSSA